MIQPIGHFRVWRALYTKPIWLNSKLEQQVILMTLMAMANFKPNEWEWKGEKYKLKEGQFITSLESIRINTGGTVSIQNIRTALKRFEKLEFLTSESTKEGRLITLVNWQDYQYIEGQPNKELNKDLTKSQQRPNKDLTPIEEGKKVEKVDKVIKEDIYIKYAEYVKMKEIEYNKLIEKYGEDITKEMIEVLDNYKGSKGKTYKSDYRAILSWVVDKVTKIKEGNYANRQTGVKTSGVVSDYIKNSGSQKFYNPKEV